MIWQVALANFTTFFFPFPIDSSNLLLIFYIFVMLQGLFVYMELINNICCSSSQNILLILFGLLVMWGWVGFVFLWVFVFCKHLVPQQWVEFFQE
jgi:hypothetical protein